MLTSLTIQNIVLIDKSEIKFSSGLCVLSGETGSGKSILLDALGLAIGFRSSFRLIGGDENKALVTAEFDIKDNSQCQEVLKENDLFDSYNPSQLRIRRTIQENSSSKVYVNDHLVGVNLLAKIGETLVEIHGQHDQRGLLNSSCHLDILDQFSGSDSYLENLKKSYEKLKVVDDKINELRAKKEQAIREKDYLEHVVRELENANIKVGEEEELVTAKNQLSAKEKILGFLSDLKVDVTEANSQLISAQRILIRNQNLIDNFLGESRQSLDDLNQKIDQMNSDLDSAVTDVSMIIKELSGSDRNLEEIEERLFQLRSLARKFSVTVDELPRIMSDAEEKLHLLNHEEEVNSGLEKQRMELFKEYKKTADDLSAKRKQMAEVLSKKVEEELSFLKMANTKFLVKVTDVEDGEYYSAKGYNRVSFLASINKNDFDDIAKIASGGELSRFMLALKVALMNVKSVPVMIFDEIDTGIGGSVSDAVGKRLKALSKNLQILVVTHQPQIAAKSDCHLKISKITTKDKVKTIIEPLDNQSRKVEIARMLSGEDITEEAMAAASKLIG